MYAPNLTAFSILSLEVNEVLNFLPERQGHDDGKALLAK